jgi:hypothetical protein
VSPESTRLLGCNGQEMRIRQKYHGETSLKQLLLLKSESMSVIMPCEI